MVAVTLREIDETNWENVVDLELTESQEPFVASNAYSLAEAAYDKHCAPLAIYAEDKVVGFIMYACMAEDGKPDDYIICRLMVDKRYQNQGMGVRVWARRSNAFHHFRTAKRSRFATNRTMQLPRISMPVSGLSRSG